MSPLRTTQRRLKSIADGAAARALDVRSIQSTLDTRTERPITVAIVSLFSAPDVTGIAVYSTGLAQYLASTGARVRLHTTFGFYPAWEKAQCDRGVLYRRGSADGLEIRRYYAYVPRRPTALRRILHEASFAFGVALGYAFSSRADCTIVVVPPLPAALPVLLLARLKSSRTIVHVQDLQPDAAIDLGMLKPGVMTGVLFWLERLTYRLADRVATISVGMQDRIVRKGVPSERTILFRNWANDRAVKPMRHDTSYRHAWGLQDKFVVMYSGNMGVKQGLASLLQAATLLATEASVVFVVVGDGGEKEGLVADAKRLGLTNVVFKPLQPYARLSDLLATADVAVIPQLPGVTDIVLPSKLGNILASARPVIVAAPIESELARLVVEADCGLVVDPRDPKRMADAVLDMVAAGAMNRARMGENGRRFSSARLGEIATLSRFAQTLRNLISSPIRSKRSVQSGRPD